MVEADLERRTVERSYRRQLARTDALLWRLEGLNLEGTVELDLEMLTELGLALVDVNPRARRRFPAATTVQEALDGIFEVQEEILVVLERLLHWDRLVATPS
jgi:hypothetical protein